MMFCIETVDGEVFEVTNLYDQNGEETRDLERVCACVIKLAEDKWGTAEVDSSVIHRVQ